MNLYIPPHSINLKDKKFPQIRLGLQGDSGTGKTFGALSFPNPVVLNFDNNLARFAGREVVDIPFHSAAWLEDYEKGKFKSQKAFPHNISNVKDALMHFIYNEARKFSIEQTLVLDSWSSVIDWFDNWFYANPIISKKGNEDSLAFWMEKINYATILFAGLKSLNCHVIVTFHEHKIRDDISGQLTDKLAPLMSGSYKDQIKKHFTEFFRTLIVNELGADKKPTGNTRHVIQVRSDSKFDAITRANIKPGTVYYDVTEPKSVWNFFEESFKAKE